MRSLITNLLCIALVVLVKSVSESRSDDQVSYERISEGKNEDITRLPYQVSIQNLNGKFICSGSLFSRRYVLTAAYCVQGKKAKFLRVRVGSNHVSKGGELIDVAKIKVHEKYSENDQYSQYDIAVLKLSKRITISDNVRLIGLSKKYATEGSHLQVSGWGSTSPQTNKTIDDLKMVEVPVWDQQSCVKFWMKKGVTITNKMICTGINGYHWGPCNNDRGAPAVLEVQYGIASWGKGCLDDKTPATLVNVPAFRGWIKKTKMELARSSP